MKSLTSGYILSYPSNIKRPYYLVFSFSMEIPETGPPERR